MIYTSDHTTLVTMTLLTLLLPLASAGVTYFISDRYSWLASLAAPLLLLISALTSVYLVMSFEIAEVAVSFPWFTLGDRMVSVTIVLNEVSVKMSAAVAIVSFLVHLYSTGYMAADKDVKGYFAMLGFFTFAMQGIVCSGDLLTTFVYWELVGYSSYRLIGHWREKPEAAAAAKKAFIINRIGDLGFLVGLMIVWSHVGSFTIDALITAVHETNSESWPMVAALCIFAGIAGKSALLPFFTWLPDAMEGPTPVSALIHAATMVAAGVFLLIRLYFLFPVDTLDIVLIIGLTTSLLGALAATSQFDTKKILAYSTISQLGLMVAAVGAGAPDAALLHLLTHAFFKACLFLSVGSVIHVLHQAQQQSHIHFDVQDIRLLGGLRKKLPVTFVAFVVSGAALGGLPFTSGFLSKDAVLASFIHYAEQGGAIRWIAVVTGFVISLLSVIYIFRLIWFVFMGEENKTREMEILEPPIVMRLPLVVLTLGSLWFMVSWNPFLIGNSVTPHSTMFIVLSILWVLAGIFFSWRLFRNRKFSTRGILLNGFYLNELYNFMFVRPTLRLATVTDRVDRKWIDGLIHGVVLVQVTLAHFIGWLDKVLVDGTITGVATGIRQIGSFTRSFQSGKIQQYVLWAVVGLIIFLFWTLN